MWPKVGVMTAIATVVPTSSIRSTSARERPSAAAASAAPVRRLPYAFGRRFFLLLAAGVNVPLDLLPGWLSTVAQGLPVTHGVEAARELVAGSTLADVLPLLAAELGVGLAYAAAGLFLVRLFEVEARRGASLELA